ncbi:MAG: YbaB/EbfC family nucleoid-associated protein [Oscillospiraceae bacterium]|jgi:DNA-binding YbaB/EbfC family protein
MAKGFGGGRSGGMGGMNMNMMKQMQKMQQDMARLQEEVEAQTFTAAAGGGAVEASVSGKQEVVSIQIDPDAVDAEDVEMLQDMIVAAVNEAMRSAKAAMNEAMQKCTGGLAGLSGLGLGL